MDEKQSVLDLGSERSLSSTTRRKLHLLWMIEQPHRIPTSVASCGGNLVKQGSFLGNGSLLVARDHLSDQLAPGLKTHRQFHVSSFKKESDRHPLPNRPSNHACLKSLLPLLFQRTAYSDASPIGEKAHVEQLDAIIVFCAKGYAD
jgi:hypothetical protein